MGIALDPAYRNAQGRASADYTGVAVTYAQVAAHPVLHRQRTANRRTLVIFDEIHHAGDALSWGEAVREAFEPARRRLALTGTPFRSDANPIPFVTYVDGRRRRQAQRLGLRLRVRSCPGRRRRPAGDLPGLLRRDALADPGRRRDHRHPGHPDDRRPARAGLADRAGPGRGVDRRVLEAADRRLTEVRRGMPDAAGLVIAGDHDDARAYAALLRRLTGKRPVVVLSDDPTASKKIAAFADVRRPVDGRGPDGLRGRGHPAAGRRRLRDQRGHRAVLRAGGGPVRPGPAARRDRVGVPALDSRSCSATPPSWRPNATTCWHARRRRRRRAGARRGAARRDTPDAARRALPFQALQASAHFDRVLYDGGEFGTVGGGRGLPRPARPARTRPGRAAAAQAPGRAGQQAPLRQASAGPRSARPEPRAPDRLAAGHHASRRAAGPPGETLAALRKELNGLVGAWHHRTGQPHAVIHADLRRTCGGPPLPQATAEQIRARIDTDPPLGVRRPLTSDSAGLPRRGQHAPPYLTVMRGSGCLGHAV